jgi:hypothetical protein
MVAKAITTIPADMKLEVHAIAGATGKGQFALQ